MLLTHHWLCFVLLAVLISPACAAPSRKKYSPRLNYRVTVVNATGSRVDDVPKSMQIRIARFIFDMGEKLGDGKGRSREKNIKYQNPPGSLKSQKKFDRLEMLYIELEEGTFCSKKCYGYIVSPDKNYGDAIGAFITQDEDRYVIIHKPILSSRTSDEAYQQLWEDKLYEFLTKFVPIKEWVVAMAKDNKGDTPLDIVLRDAANLLDPSAVTSDPSVEDAANVLLGMSAAIHPAPSG